MSTNSNYGIWDANSWYSRSYYAANEDVHEGFKLGITTLLNQLDFHSSRLPDVLTHTLFCWDTGRKSNKPRDPKPKEYDEGIVTIREILTKLFNSAHAIPPCHEADDAVATAALRQKTGNVYVISGDKDLHALIGDNCYYYCLNNRAVLSRNFVLSKWGIKRPSQVPLALAIIGDHSDGITGIRGWGPAKAKALFENVTEDMSFSQALDKIDSMIPDAKKDEFYTSLNATMLDPEVPGVPEPAPLRFTDEPILEELGFPTVQTYYDQVKLQYEDRATDSAPGKFDEAEY